MSNPQYVAYHDEEWGRPVHDDRKLFEMLTLEGAQAGLSWETILRKRAGYLELFDGLDPGVVARYSDARLDSVLTDARIVRNRLKVYSVRTNARAFLEVSEHHGSFSEYLWAFAGRRPIVNSWRDSSEVPATTELSDRLSVDMKRRGFSFVGSTIVYAYLQAVGIVNDHTTNCFLGRPCS